ncbi:MAG: class I SAM-dependent methyltransferase family protein [Candidatus Brockarchaeota archaeon]|nr:class I SAM-dependent methyltransferase family protein [Candidatus Brockarchaeota archaeon]MBO3807991.1 class I SAM-dependent methyltransferase family protein [Candidatus Brockarchaeota archaeon]
MRIGRGVRVRKLFGEHVLRILRARNLVDNSLLIKRRGDFLVIPLAGEVEREELRRLGVEADLVVEEFEEATRVPSLFENLKGILSEDDLEIIPRSYDVIGDVCILQLPRALYDRRRIIGEAFLKSMKNIRIVLNKTEPLSGEYRVGGYEVLAGEGGTETIYREHGCVFKLDVSKVFFTPRLSAERIRVASLVKPGEVVCDLFAGIGPFSIIIAKKNPSVRVHACDINPHAYQYLVENVRLNKVEDRVKAYLGDARELSVRDLKNVGDRIIMNLPMSSEMYLDAARNALKKQGGVVHLHVFLGKNTDPVEKYASIEESFRKLDCETRLLSSRRIREVAPFKYHWGFDIEVKPKSG